MLYHCFMARYRYRYIPVTHPLVSICGYTLGKRGASIGVGEHRVVLFEKIGPGIHPCHWCEAPLVWRKGVRAGTLVVDHLNGVIADNSPENLVPSCNGCNSIRAREFRPQMKPGEIRTNWKGARQRGVERVCVECGATFVTTKAVIARGDGRYCSQSCVGNYNARIRWGLIGSNLKK